MKNKIILDILDKKLKRYYPLRNDNPPPDGWIFAIRSSLRMSLRHIAKKMCITPQSVKDIERREKRGAVTLQAMKQVADAMDMHFVYAIVPKEANIYKYIEKKALEAAVRLYAKSSGTENIQEKNMQSDTYIKIRAKSLASDLPKFLWE